MTGREDEFLDSLIDNFCTIIASKIMDKMHKSAETTVNTDNSITVDTEELQKRLHCGSSTAVEIGTAAGARIKVGKRVLWYVKNVDEYLNRIAGDYENM